MTMTNERFWEVENSLWKWVEKEHKSKFSREMALYAYVDGLPELVRSVGGTTPGWTENCPQIFQQVVEETGIPAEEIIYYLKTATEYPWEFADSSDFEDGYDDWEDE